MKKIFILSAFLIFTLVFTPVKDVSAFDNDGIGAEVHQSSDGKMWTIDIGWDENNGPPAYSPGDSFTFNFGAYWCSRYNILIPRNTHCDGNSWDYRGVHQTKSFTIKLPEKGQLTTVTANFDNLKAEYTNDPDGGCGRIQADVEHGGTVTGEIYPTSKDCPTQTSLSCFGPPAKLVSSWNIGYNDDPGCKIWITAGSTPYKLSDTKCNSSWDSSVNPIPSGLSIHDGGIYQLSAGDTDGGVATCPSPPPECPTSGAGTTQTCGQTTYDICVDNKNQSGSTLCKNGATGFRCYYSADPNRCLSGSSAADFNYSCSACYVQIGGTISRRTGGGLSGVEVNRGITDPPTCNIGTTITDTLGVYRFNNIYYGTSFCLRPPSVSGYTGPNPTSSENQVATANKTDYNFSYTPSIAPSQITLTCESRDSNGNVITSANINQPVTWVVDIRGGTSPFNYSWSGTDSLSNITSSSSSRTNSVPPKTYTTAGSKTANVTVTDSSSPIQSKSASCSVIITAPDLQVEPLSPVTVEVNNPVSISSTVKNYGDGTTGTSSTTRLKIDTKDANDDKPTAILAAGGTASHTWSSVWTPTTAGTYNYQVCADVTFAVSESNENNNCKVSSITVNVPAAPGAPSTPTVSYPACTTAAYSATVSWTGNPLPSTDPTGCPNEYWVDIDNDGDFGNGYFHKCTTSTFTIAPAGFGAYAGASGSLTLQPDLTYYARVYNGNISGVRSFSSPTCSAAFNYSLTNSGGISVKQGTSGANTITRTLTSGTSQPVTLSVLSGLPSGASASFTSNPSSPTSPSILTISTSPSTPIGSYNITVTGSPLSKTTTFTLTVTSPLGPGLCNGNNICDPGEVTASCPTDCPSIPGGSCPNNTCEAGETTASCPIDCPGGGPICGNNKCEGIEPITCRPDCPGVPAPIRRSKPWIQIKGDVHSNTGIR